VDPKAATRTSASRVVLDGTEIGMIEVADIPAAGAREVVQRLRDMHIEVVMVTGDREGPAQYIAEAVGITKIHADVRPTAKAAIVDGERWGGHRVAMVGDGINDAPALAAADLGVAIGSGAELAAAASDVTLIRGGIRSLPIALGLARATLHTIRRNLIAAFAYNAVCIPIAAAGLLSPMFAAAAMSLSSVSVLLLSLRLKRWQMR
jgi:Cu+-exporting ATPase